MHSARLAFAGSLLVTVVALASGRASAQEPSPIADAESFSPVVTNSFFPLASVRYKEYAGAETDPDTGETIQTRVEETILPETEEVAGVEVTVVEVKEYEDDELVELTHDYYAQDADGTVHYFGETVDDYEDGEVVGHSGAWLAGEGDNQPGVFMPPDPRVGDIFEQERAPGIAEDISTVLEIDASISTPAGDFTECLKTEDVNPIDGDTENKYYCPGVGIVREESANSALDLVRFEESPAATPTAAS